MAAAIVVAAVLLLGLLPAYAALTTARAQTADAQARLNQAQAVLNQFQVDQGQLEQVDQQIEQMRDQIAQLRAELETVGQGRTFRSDGIKAAVVALVPTVRITSIAQGGDIFTLTGEADSRGLVLDYARALQSSGCFSNVRVLSIVSADPLAQEVEFSIEMKR